MSAFFLALLAAAMYGTGDFLGGMAGRRAPMFAATAMALWVGWGWLVLTVWIISPTTPPLGDLVWGAVAGVAGSVGITLIYRGLATGRMSVVAPICGVSAIAAPVVFGVWLGERPSGMAWLGVALAVAAVVLCGQERRVPLREREAKSGLQKPAALAVMAGLMIGFFYICLQRTSHAAGMWPVLAARTVSAFLVTLMAFGAKQSLRLPSAARWLVVGAGIVDTSANMAFQGAVRLGDLSIVATIASLYPAATIILARTVLKERFSGVQIAGMAVAVVSVILISTG